MSLNVNEGSGKNYEPIEPGTYPAVCYMMVDLGDQFSKTYNNTQHKVQIGWELPTEKREDGSPQFIYKRYTASLNSKAALRGDLEAWRGKAFTAEELKGFNLSNIVGAPCLLTIIHRDGTDGKTYANIASISGLPKGMPLVAMTVDPIIYDIDANPLEDVDNLPEWIAKIVMESANYKEKKAFLEEKESGKFKQAGKAVDVQYTDMSDINDAEGELPF